MALVPLPWFYGKCCGKGSTWKDYRGLLEGLWLLEERSTNRYETLLILKLYLHFKTEVAVVLTSDLKNKCCRKLKYTYCCCWRPRWPRAMPTRAKNRSFWRTILLHDPNDSEASFRMMNLPLPNKLQSIGYGVAPGHNKSYVTAQNAVTKLVAYCKRACLLVFPTEKCK